MRKGQTKNRRRRAAPGTRDSAAPIRPGITALPASLIREVADIGMTMEEMIPLWFGEGDRPTPGFINRAAMRALDAGHTFYTDNRGIPELREALVEYTNRLYGISVDVERVTATASGMNALMLSQQCLVEPGDNVVVVVPLWPNLVETVHIMGGETRPIALTLGESGWSLDLDRLFDACDGRTRAVMINSPGNPTGWMMTAGEQRAVLEFCRGRGIWVVTDEVYARIVYDRPHAPSFLEWAEPDDAVIVVNSFSKAWSMTGWRLGWITGPPRLGPVLSKMNEYNVAAPTTFVQHAGVTALGDGEPYVAATVERYRRGRDLVCESLGGMRRVRLARPEAAFYAFFAVDGMTDSLAFAKRLIAEARVGLAPGSAFGAEGEGYLRLCFASSTERLTEAIRRLAPILD